MKVQELLTETKQIERIDDAGFRIRMLARHLKKQGVESAVGVNRAWNLPELKFYAGPTVHFQVVYDETDEEPWVAIRFDSNYKTSYIRRQYDDDKKLIDDMLNGRW